MNKSKGEVIMEKRFHEWEDEILTLLKDNLSVFAKALDNNDFGLSVDDVTSEIIIRDKKNSNEKILVLRTKDIRILCNTLKKGVDDDRYDDELKDRICKTLKDVAKNNPEIHDVLRQSTDPKITEVFPFSKKRFYDMDTNDVNTNYYFAKVLFYDGYSHAEISLSPTGTYGRPCSGFCIGHSYFCNLTKEKCTPEKLRTIVKYDILPTLKEYWFDEKDTYNDWKQQLEDLLHDKG